MKTIREAFEMDDTQLDDVAKHLFHQTCGHPRSLMVAFKTCRTFSQLMDYSQPIEIENWTLLYAELRKYRNHVLGLLKNMTNKADVDLTEKVEDGGKRLISLDLIANNCCIAWEGTVEQAKLYATPFMLQLIMQYSLPLQAYISAMAGAKFSVDYSTVFEWICLKRFQELFSSAQSPTVALPEFFN